MALFVVAALLNKIKVKEYQVSINLQRLSFFLINGNPSIILNDLSYFRNARFLLRALKQRAEIEATLVNTLLLLSIVWTCSSEGYSVKMATGSFRPLNSYQFSNKIYCIK